MKVENTCLRCRLKLLQVLNLIYGEYFPWETLLWKESACVCLFLIFFFVIFVTSCLGSSLITSKSYQNNNFWRYHFWENIFFLSFKESRRLKTYACRVTLNQWSIPQTIRMLCFPVDIKGNLKFFFFLEKLEVSCFLLKDHFINPDLLQSN